jgi:hypothetical protein
VCVLRYQLLLQEGSRFEHVTFAFGPLPSEGCFIGRACKKCSRRSEGARYTKSIFMANLKRTIDKITISADLSKLYYTGQHGVRAPGTADEIAHYTTLAVREMRKKAARRRR